MKKCKDCQLIQGIKARPYVVDHFCIYKMVVHPEDEACIKLKKAIKGSKQ